MKTTCKYALARLTALRDGELTPAMAKRVEAHLDECAECARAWQEQEAVLHAADAWQTEGGEVWGAVEAQISAETLQDLVAGMQAMQAEVCALRAEMKELRAQKSVPVSDVARRPSALLPYPSTNAEPPVRLV